MFNFEFSAWQLFFEVKGRYLQKIKNYKFFKVAVKKKNENSAALARPNFYGIYLLKIYPIDSKVSSFENR